MWRRVVILLVAGGCTVDESGMLGEPDAAGDVDVDATLDATLDALPPDANDEPSADAGADAPTEAAYDAGVEAGPIITITGGSYTLLGPDAGVCSMNSATPTNFQVTNDRDASIDLFWVDFQCAEKSYGVVAPLGTYNQGTYVTHVWRIRNDADKAFLASFVLNVAGTFAVTIH